MQAFLNLRWFECDVTGRQPKHIGNGLGTLIGNMDRKCAEQGALTGCCEAMRLTVILAPAHHLLVQSHAPCRRPKGSYLPGAPDWCARPQHIAAGSSIKDGEKDRRSTRRTNISSLRE